MDTRLMVRLAAALIPLAVGAIWYSPMVFGKIMKKANGDTGDKMKTWHALLVYAATYLLSFYITGTLVSIVIHQYGILSMLANYHDQVHTAGTELNKTVQGLLNTYEGEFRTFKHGALHGSFTGLLLVAPILLIITLFERRKWQWFIIHAIYWIICLTLMGGVICAYMPIHIQLAQ